MSLAAVIEKPTRRLLNFRERQRDAKRAPDVAASAGVIVETMTPSSTAAAAVADEADERVWLAAAREGEPWALARFYNAYYPLVWGLCRRVLRAEADAEDALQSTFVRAFAALPRFRGENRDGQSASIKTWIYRIAVNESTTILRRRAAQPITVSLDDERDAAGEAAAAVGDGIRGGSAGDGARVAEQVVVRELLQHLKPDHRMVIALRFWEDLSYEEIAAVLDLPLATVKMRLHRAKEEFRRLYDGDDTLFTKQEAAR